MAQSRLQPRINFGDTVMAALRLQRVYERDPARYPSVHSIEVGSNSWSFTFFVGEDYPKGGLLACSDFRISASEEDNWEPKLSEIVTPGFSPSPTAWVSQVSHEFSRQYLACSSGGASEEVAKTVLNELPLEDLGSQFHVEDWEPEHICLDFLKSHIRLGLSCKPGEALGWWCFFHGSGVARSSPQCNSPEGVRDALAKVLAEAKAAHAKRGCRWCCPSS